MTVPPTIDLPPPLVPQKSFARRNRATMGCAFWFVFAVCFFVTLFQPAIYQATAVIVLPPAPDPYTEAASLQAPDVIHEAAARVTTATPGTELIVRAVASGSAMPGRFALIVESDSRSYTIALADAWAATVTADSSGKARIVMHADGPNYPIRPKKGQSLLIGVILATILAFATGGIADLLRRPKT